MNEKELLLEFALSLPNAVADHPFEDDFETTILRHGMEGKWFGALMKVGKRRVGLDEDGLIEILNLKIDPEEAYAVRELFDGIIPAYHMNKRHWVSVLLNGTVPTEFTSLLIEKSYDLTKKKLPKCKIEQNSKKEPNM